MNNCINCATGTTNASNECVVNNGYLYILGTNTLVKCDVMCASCEGAINNCSECS